MVGRRVLRGVAACLIALTCAAPASAQEAAPPAEALAPAPMPDTVYLRNGGFYRGQVTEIVPGDHATLASGGTSRNVPWAEIDRLVLSAGPGMPPTVLRAEPAAAAPSATPPPIVASTPAALEAPPVDAPPHTQWQANRPLLVTGAVLFAAGYGPNLVAAAPSTVGLAGRVLLLVMTLGLPCWFSGNGSYVCDGSHGAMQLLVPFAGPFLFAADHPHDSVLNERGRPLSDVSKGLLYTSGGLQIAGLASILTALVLGRQQPVPGLKRAETSPSVFVLPQTGAGVLGVTVGVQRW